MKKFFILFFIIFTISLNAQYISIVEKGMEKYIVSYYRFDNIYIGLSNEQLYGTGIYLSVPYKEDVEYYMIESSSGLEIKNGNILYSSDKYSLVEADNITKIEFQKGNIIKLIFSIQIKELFQPKSVFIPNLSNYTQLDSLSQYVEKDSLYSIVAVLSGENDYPYGSNFRTRFVTQPGCDTASYYLYDRFVSYGLDTVFFEDFSGTTGSWAGGNPYNTRNIIAIKRGSRTSDTCVVVGAHFDSISQPYDEDTTTAPGADDNASGTAGVHEIARLFAQHGIDNDIDIYFVDFSAEEIGLVGSYHFVYDYIESLGVYVKGMINMDMISYNDNLDNVDVYGNSNSYPLKYLFMDIGNNITTLTYNDAGSSGGSDHYYFEKAGYMTAFAIEGSYYTYSGYHTPGDTIGWLDFDFAKDIVRTAFATTYYVSNMPGYVEGISLIDNGDSSVTIKWEKQYSLDIDFYKIYYRCEDGNEMNVSVPDTNEWTLLSLIPDTLYYFSVVAVDTNGFEGFANLSDTITPSFVPHATLISNAYSDSVNIFVFFNKSKIKDVSYYNVYRKMQEDSDFILVGYTEDTTFVDSSINDTMIYQYVVTVIDSMGLESAYSNIANIRIITRERGLMVIDETANSVTYSDDATDMFYDSVFNDYFKCLVDADSIDSITIKDFGNFSTVFYIDDDLVPTGNKLNMRDMIQFINNGGTFIYMGWDAGKKLIGDPSDLPYYTNTNSIAYTEMGIEYYNRNTNYDMQYMYYNVNGEDTVWFDEDKLPRGSNGLLNYGGVFGLDSNKTIATGYYKSYSDSIGFNGYTTMFTNQDSSLWIINIPLYPLNLTNARILVDKVLFTNGIVSGLKKEPIYNRQSVYFYCRPVSDKLEIMLEGIKNKKVEIILFDITGRKIATILNQKIYNDKLILSESIPFVTGIYFVRVNINGIDYIKKIVKIYK